MAIVPGARAALCLVGVLCLVPVASLRPTRAQTARLAATVIPRAAAPPVALAPSGVDGLPLPLQAGAFFATFTALGASSFAIDRAYGVVRRWRPGWLWDAWEIGAAALLGAIFVTAGRSLFTVPEAFIAIYPPPGTWGFWYLPGSANFHVRRPAVKPLRPSPASAEG